MLLADRGYDADWIRVSPLKGVLGPTFRPDLTEETRSTSAHTFIAPEIATRPSSVDFDQI